MSVALFMRPNFDTATKYGFYFMGLAIDHALARGMRVVDLAGESARKAPYLDALAAEDPLFCYMLGHGNEDTYTGQKKEVIMKTCSGDETLIGRVALLLSCLTANRLGPSIVNKGGLAYFGWVVSFTWVVQEDYDPATDRYAGGFFEAVNAISNTLADGGTTRAAMDASIAVWNRWIDYWTRSDDPYASEVVKWMVYDRDGQRLLGAEDARIHVPVPAVTPMPFIQMPFAAGLLVTMAGLYPPKR
jgi:hypothetical protein